MKNVISGLSAVFIFLATVIGCGSPSGGGAVDAGDSHGEHSGAVALKADYTADGDDFNIVENPGGSVVAVWRVWDGSGFNIYGQHYSADSDTWGDTKTITSVEGKAGYPQVVVDDFDNAVVAWQQSDESSDSIYANRYDSGAGWGEPVRLLEASTGSVGHPSLALDENGNVVAVWQLEVDDTYIVYASVYDTSVGVWSVSEPLSSGGSTYNLQLVIDDVGSVITMWEQWDGTANKTFGTNYDLTANVWLSTELEIDGGRL